MAVRDLFRGMLPIAFLIAPAARCGPVIGDEPLPASLPI